MGLFQRISRLTRGFLSHFIGGLEEKSPEALLEAAREDYREEVASYQQALARIAGISERLKQQIERKTEKSEILENRIMANLKAGNEEMAGTLARELAELKSDLESDSKEYRETEAAYQDNLKNLKRIQQEFSAKINDLERQLNRAKVREAQAEAAATLSGLSFETGDAGDTLKRAEEVVDRKLEDASGRLRLTKDLGGEGTVEARETERRMLEQDALAEFKKQHGLPPGSKVEALPEKTSGTESEDG
jgi:phage shock protein A